MNPAVRQLLLTPRFSPESLFRAGEQGVWFDPSDLSTLFQDSAGTTPVTAAGQPVGKVLDKSGRGNHAVQATAASRPQWLIDANGYPYFGLDGTDDGLATASINFTGTDKMTVIAGVHKASDAATAPVLELSADLGLNTGAFSVFAPVQSTASYRLISKGTATGTAATGAAAFPAPHSAVLTGQGDIAGDSSILRVNGAVAATAATDQGTGSYGNYALYIGRRGGTTLPFNGRIYSLCVVGRSVDETTLRRAERYMGKRMGLGF
jgi:hypothetical protein